MPCTGLNSAARHGPCSFRPGPAWPVSFLLFKVRPGPRIARPGAARLCFPYRGPARLFMQQNKSLFQWSMPLSSNWQLLSCFNYTACNSYTIHMTWTGMLDGTSRAWLKCLTFRAPQQVELRCGNLLQLQKWSTDFISKHPSIEKLGRNCNQNVQTCASGRPKTCGKTIDTRN